VRTLPFEEVFKDRTAGNTKLQTREYKHCGKFPIIDQGVQEVAGYTDDRSALASVELPVIIFGDHTRLLKYRDRPFVVGADGTKVLSPRRDADARFLFHYLRSVDIPSAGYSRHYKFLKAIRIPFPPFDEQRRIAAILDKADELRTKRRQALAYLDTLTQSIFHSMFGDPVVAPNKRALRELLASIDSGSSPVSADRPADGGEWGILKLSAVTSQTFIETENKALLTTAPVVRHEVRTGDVLFTRKNTPNLVAAVAIVRNARGKLLLPDLIFRLNIADRRTLEPEYLHAVMSCPTQRSSIQRLAGGAAASMSSISKAKLLTVPIPVPPLDLQQTFATRVAAVERLKENHRKHLAELDALFASLQHRAFKGEL
jgi:type I restriction enzyme S subunit